MIAHETPFAQRSQRTHTFANRDEDSAVHGQINNLALPNQVTFDWLDTVFPQS